MPPPCAKTPGQRSPPNRFHRGLPKPHGGPGPLPIAPPVPAGVRRGEAQLWPPSLPVPAPLLGVMVAAAAEGRCGAAGAEERRGGRAGGPGKAGPVPG